MTDFIADEIVQRLAEKVNKQIADDVIERYMTDIERENQKRRAVMSGHVETDRGFEARAMVDPHEGTVHNLTTREEGKKRGKLIATPVRIISEEQFQRMASVHNNLFDKTRRAAEMMNELAMDHGRHDHHGMGGCETPRRDRVQEGSGIEGWNKACDDTILRHQEQRKALSSYRDSELGRERIREAGGISRALLNVIEALEAVLQARPTEDKSPEIEQTNDGKETVITIRIPEGASMPPFMQ